MTARQTITLRLTEKTHNQVKLLAKIQKESVNGLIEKAINDLIDKSSFYENIKTKNESFYIQIKKDLYNFNELTLYSTYAGSTHLVLYNIEDCHLEKAIDQLNNMIDFIDFSLDS